MVGVVVMAWRMVGIVWCVGYFLRVVAAVVNNGVVNKQVTLSRCFSYIYKNLLSSKYVQNELIILAPPSMPKLSWNLLKLEVKTIF